MLKIGYKLIAGLQTTGYKTKPNFEEVLHKEHQGDAEEDIVDLQTELVATGQTYKRTAGETSTHEDYETIREAAAAGVIVSFVYGRFVFGGKIVSGSARIADYTEDADSKNTGTYSITLNTDPKTIVFDTYTDDSLQQYWELQANAILGSGNFIQFDPQDASSLIFSDGNVRRINDKLGSGRYLEGNCGFNNGALTFNGADQFLKSLQWTGLDQPYRVYIVFCVDDELNVNHRIFDAYTGDRGTLYGSHSFLHLNMRAGAQLPQPENYISDNKFMMLGTTQLVRTFFNGANSSLKFGDEIELSIDGNYLRGDAGSYAPDGFTLGAAADLSRFAAITVSEVILSFQNENSDDEDTLKTYLQHKHIFKNQFTAPIFVMTWDGDVNDIYEGVKEVLAKYDVPSTLFICGNSLGGRMLSIEQIHDMVSTCKVEIQAHGYNHPGFDTLTEDELIDNMSDMDDVVMRVLGYPRTTFVAPPYGRDSRDIVNIIARYKQGTRNGHQQCLMNREIDPRTFPTLVFGHGYPYHQVGTLASAKNLLDYAAANKSALIWAAHGTDSVQNGMQTKDFDDIIAYAKGAGFIFMTLSDFFQDVVLKNYIPPVWATKVASGMTATYIDETTCKLSWQNNNAADVDGFEVYTSTDGGETWSLFDTVTGLDDEYTAEELDDDKTYWFRLQYYKGTVKGLKSNKKLAIRHDPLYDLIWDKLTIKPVEADVANQRAMISGLKSIGVYDKTSVIQVYALHNSSDSLINWKAPNKTGGAMVLTPTFTAYEGWKGDGTNYITIGYNPRNDENIGKDDITIMVGIGDNIAQSADDISCNGGTERYQLRSRRAGADYSVLRCGENTEKTVTNTNAKAHYALARNNESYYYYYRNKVRTTVETTSLGVPNAATVAALSSRTVRYVIIASYLTQEEIENTIDVMETYLDKYEAGLIV